MRPASSTGQKGIDMPAGKNWLRSLGAISTALILVLSLTSIVSASAGASVGVEAAYVAGRGGHVGYCPTTTRPQATTSSTRCDHTTTTEETTTSTEETTTTEATTTTVPNEVLPTEVTTSTVPAEVLPTEVTTSTVPAEVLPTEVTAVTAEAETLPFTGSHDLGWLLIGGAALILGFVLVVASRREET